MCHCRLYEEEKIMFYDNLPISADPPQVPCCDCLANLIMASVYNLEAEAAPEDKNKKETPISTMFNLILDIFYKFLY